MSDTQDWSLASAEKAAILSCMAAHPEASKIELAKLLGITPLTLAKKQKEYGVYKKDKRGRPKVKVDYEATGTKLEKVTGVIRIESKLLDGETGIHDASAVDYDQALPGKEWEVKAEGEEYMAVSRTEIPTFQTVVKDEGEE